MLIQTLLKARFQQHCTVFGCLQETLLITTGWEIGTVTGIEKRKRDMLGQYIVKYPTERKPYWHTLDIDEYGHEEYWVLMKK